MKRLLAFVAFLVVGIILFWGVVRVVGWGEVWNAAKGFWGYKGALLLLLSLVMIGLGAVRWKEILRHQGYHVPFFSILKQYFGGFALSFFFPMVFFGSELFRSYALKEFHGVPLQRAIVSAVVERFLEITAYLLFLVAGIGFLLVSKNVFVAPLFWWILFGAGVLALFLAFFYFKSHRKESIIRMFFPRLSGSNGFLDMELELLHFFSWKNRAFWEGLLLSFARASFALVRTFVLAGFLGKAVSFFPAVVITSFTFLSLLIPIPGQLGSHEALLVLAFQLLGLQGHAGASFAFLVRAVEAFVAIVGLVFFARIGMVLLGRSALNKTARIFQNLFDTP